MNRTAAFLTLAAGLALTALVLGRPPSPAPARPPPLPAPVAASDGALSMSARLSHPAVTAGPSELFVTVDVRGASVPGAPRSPVQLALVIDRSGSMSGYKLEQAKRAARHLVGLLDAQDRLAIVHYGSDVEVLPSLAATPAHRERMLAFIEGIAPGGGTNIASGLGAGEAALAAARADFRTNRLILISDGQPTEGTTDPRTLVALAERIRAEGVTLSAIGVGADFNEDLLQAVAQVGAGAYGFLEDAAQLATLFQKDLSQATTAVARDVALTFELPEGVALGEVLGYRSQQEGARVRVALSDFAAGQHERVVVRLALAGDATAVGRSRPVAHLRLGYTDLLAQRGVESRAQLAAQVTERPEEVAAQQDKEATVLAVRALSARNLEKAARALEAGDKDEARNHIRANEVLLFSASQVAGAAPVAADVAAQRSALEQIDAAATPEAQRSAAKRQKAEAQRGYGRMGSTY